MQTEAAIAEAVAQYQCDNLPDVRQRRWRADPAVVARALWLRWSGWTYGQIACALDISSSGAHNMVKRWCRRLQIPHPTGCRVVDGPEIPEDLPIVQMERRIYAPHRVATLARTLARLHLSGGQMYGRPATISKALGSSDVARLRRVLREMRDTRLVAYAETLAADGTPRWQVTQTVHL